ncbi:MAG: hypothetical protein LUG60_01335 [Erysipelotrichaceae bacterium]|nr:hypothetical protein [Erysipelotrichaceae bacterium]
MLKVMVYLFIKRHVMLQDYKVNSTIAVVMKTAAFIFYKMIVYWFL